MNKNFNLFMSQLQETNQTLDFFCDFDKISANVAEVEMSLNTLNYLIGKEDLAKGVLELWQRDSRVFEVLGILIAVRDEGKKPVVDSKGNVVLLKSYFESSKRVVEFLQGTGLAEIFQSRRIKNLVDYVFGIETGIETRSKKYLIEVNFYSGGGSKLNEVARAYTELAPKVNSVEGYEFVWITDGIGWKSARNKLEEAYNTIPSVYNLTNVTAFIESLKR